MAIPIGETPELSGEELVLFSKRLKQGLDRPAKMVPTPNLKKALERVKNILKHSET